MAPWDRLEGTDPPPLLQGASGHPPGAPIPEMPHSYQPAPTRPPTPTWPGVPAAPPPGRPPRQAPLLPTARTPSQIAALPDAEVIRLADFAYIDAVERRRREAALAHAKDGSSWGSQATLLAEDDDSKLPLDYDPLVMGLPGSRIGPKERKPKNCRKCCGKGCCCCCLYTVPAKWACAVTTVAILAGVGVALFFCWPRLPTSSDVYVGTPAVVPGSSVFALSPAQRSSFSPTFSADLRVPLSVRSPMMIPLTLDSISVDLTYRPPDGSTAAKLASGTIPRPYFPARSNASFILSLRVAYSGTGLGDPVVQGLLVDCGFAPGGPPYSPSLRIPLRYDAVAVLGAPLSSIRPSFGGPISRGGEAGGVREAGLPGGFGGGRGSGGDVARGRGEAAVVGGDRVGRLMSPGLWAGTNRGLESEAGGDGRLFGRRRVDLSRTGGGASIPSLTTLVKVADRYPRYLLCGPPSGLRAAPPRRGPFHVLSAGRSARQNATPYGRPYGGQASPGASQPDVIASGAPRLTQPSRAPRPSSAFPGTAERERGGGD
ncbi:hypothetical protein DFJ74DRAFT_518768 [Hyaloraphidium curvatum]|nr:hypothetical protein DFJ74DRAFT_518768 [Hyaloraphidium curvatum]